MMTLDNTINGCSHKAVLPIYLVLFYPEMLSHCGVTDVLSSCNLVSRNLDVWRMYTSEQVLYGMRYTTLAFLSGGITSLGRTKKPSLVSYMHSNIHLGLNSPNHL